MLLPAGANATNGIGDSPLSSIQDKRLSLDDFMAMIPFLRTAAQPPTIPLPSTGNAGHAATR
ncbi:MAG TPA: hypothetical protein VNM91_02235 [Dehalococcoidia bacterium]|nr:hypothetical protein [Dehalococcoidia bacterium]